MMQVIDLAYVVAHPQSALDMIDRLVSERDEARTLAAAAAAGFQAARESEQATVARASDADIANRAVLANLNPDETPKHGDAHGYACAMEAIRLARGNSCSDDEAV